MPSRVILIEVELFVGNIECGGGNCSTVRLGNYGVTVNEEKTGQGKTEGAEEQEGWDWFLEGHKNRVLLSR